MKPQRPVVLLLAAVIAVALVVIAVVLVVQLRDGDDRPTSFSNGTYLVGTDVATGEYQTDGALNAETPCTVTVSKEPDAGSLVDARTTNGPTTFRLATGLYVTSAGCQKWERTN